MVASSCSGAFLVAEAGILDGRSATTHWMYAEKLRRRYPAVWVAAERFAERERQRRGPASC